MPIEIKYLGCTIALGLIYLILAATLGTAQRGLAWNTSNRDGEPKPLTGAAARAARACRNFLETFPFFAAAILAVVLAKTNSPATAQGAQIYLWARLIYLPVYVIGIPYLRTLVWAASLVGVLKVLWALF